jgi:hypothetical protein
LRLALKALVGVFAAIGVAYTAFALYVYLFLPSCTFAETAQMISPDGKHFAVREQRMCKNVDDSWSRVVLGKPGMQERWVVVEVRGAGSVSLVWEHSQELVVTYPLGASVRQLGTDGDWPRVTLRHAGE